MRIFWGTVGVLGVILAFAGMVLPVLPTVPFALLAAFSFNRSSPRFHNMLMGHRVLGPQIREWQQHRAIDPRVKLVAVGSMIVGLSISWFILPPLYWTIQLSILVAAAAFVLTRANPPPAV